MDGAQDTTSSKYLIITRIKRPHGVYRWNEIFYKNIEECLEVYTLSKGMVQLKMFAPSQID